MKTLKIISLIIAMVAVMLTDAQAKDYEVDVGTNKVTWSEKNIAETNEEPMYSVENVKVNGVKINIDEFGRGTNPAATSESIKQHGNFLAVEYANSGSCNDCEGFNIIQLKPTPIYLGIFQLDDQNRIYKIQSIFSDYYSHAAQIFWNEYYTIGIGTATLDKGLTCKAAKADIKKYVKDIKDHALNKKFQYSKDTTDALPVLYAGLKLAKMCDTKEFENLLDALSSHCGKRREPVSSDIINEYMKILDITENTGERESDVE